MKLKGGSINAKELQTFLKESYEDPPKQNIMGYELDYKLSSQSVFDKQMTARVYVNEDQKKVMITHRGTGMEMHGTDWLNNAVYAASTAAYRLTPRFKRAKLVQDKAIKKYSAFEINSIGHSQGGLIVHLLNSSKIKNSIGFNPASKNEMLDKNEYIIRSSGDAVSALSIPNQMLNNTLYPGWTKRHMISIKDETGDPVAEHSPNIIDRLDPELIIGKGVSKKCGCKKQRKIRGYIINQCLC
jgi:hypothetical protein